MRDARAHWLRMAGGGGLLFGVALALACASVQAPPGGPVDRTPPTLLAIAPDSGAVNLVDCRTITLRFSEKMDPVPAPRFLSLFPPIAIAETKWRGRKEAQIRLAEPLPPDTVLVVEIRAGLYDAHRVPSAQSYLFPVATAAALPVGELSGQLIYRDKPLLQGVVEMFAVPPETLAYFQQPLLRRALTDSLGQFHFRWLPTTGAPWLLRAFADQNGDLRAGDGEAQRKLADEFILTAEQSRRHVGSVTLYDPSTPGRLTGRVAADPAWPGPILVWPMAIAEGDTGWVAAPQGRRPAGQQVVRTDTTVTIMGVPAPLARLIFYVDADGDSLLSALPAADTGDPAAIAFLEPHAVLDSLRVEPGLESAFSSPAFPATLSAWGPGAADSLAGESAKGRP